jgi:threonine/homoserine/homoserine lactone efflux protein
MIEMLVTSSSFAAFLVASLILAVTPGPAVIYVVTRTLGQGRKAGLSSVGGIALGNLGNAAAASVGLAAVLAASSTAFLVVKLTGAAYLVYLGLRALYARPTAESVGRPTVASPGRLLRDGFLVAFLNPKTALFFAALLPQFITPGTSPLAQSLMLSGVFVCIAMCTDSLYVLTAATLGARLRQRASWRPFGRYVTGATFIGLGVYAALASPRNTK